MKKTKKFLSVFVALVMVLGMLVPYLSNSEALSISGEITEVQTDRPNKTNVTIHKLKAKSYNPGVPTDHNGGKLKPDDLNKLGTEVGELDGVKFKYYKLKDEAKLKALIADSGNYKTEDKLTGQEGIVYKGETAATSGGNGTTVSLEEGYYWFIESDKPATATSAIAVPFGISLPLMNNVKVGTHEPGTVYLSTVHVYPKNTVDKPKMDKDFEKDSNDPEIDSKEYTDGKAGYGANPDNHLRIKDKVSSRIGAKVPYEVKTKLPKDSSYKRLHWSDVMTKGLTYNKDVTLTVEPDAGLTTDDYTITASASGFDLKMKQTGLDKLKAAAVGKELTITLKYSATLNENAVVGTVEENNIKLDYGNIPDVNKEPEPTEPSDNGEIKVNKTWASGVTPGGIKVKYFLFEKSADGNDKVVDVAEVNTQPYTHTFTGLDKSKTYYVKEFVEGYEPKYLTNVKGIVNIENHVNPDQIVPTTPKVTTYGKKFVKVDKANAKKLAGAEFVVKRDNKYLAIKGKDQKEADIKAYQDAEAEYQKAVKDNKDENTINELKKTRDEKFKAMHIQWVWSDKEEAFRFVSDKDGKFEVVGLTTGTYELEEVKAPEGYALLADTVKFTVNNDSYQGLDHKVENSKVTIPQTGGIGSVVVIAAGIAIVATGLYMKKRNQKA